MNGSLDSLTLAQYFTVLWLTISETENQTVKINEIIAVKLENKSGATEGGKFQHLEMVALSATAFSIYFVKRIPRHRFVIGFVNNVTCPSMS